MGPRNRSPNVLGAQGQDSPYCYKNSYHAYLQITSTPSLTINPLLAMSRPAPGTYVIVNKVCSPYGDKLAITFNGEGNALTVTPSANSSSQRVSSAQRCANDSLYLKNASLHYSGRFRTTRMGKRPSWSPSVPLTSKLLGVLTSSLYFLPAIMSGQSDAPLPDIRASCSVFLGSGTRQSKS